MAGFKDFHASDGSTVRARKVTSAEDVVTVVGTERVSSGNYVVERPESGRGVYDVVAGKAFEENYSTSKARAKASATDTDADEADDQGKE